MNAQYPLKKFIIKYDQERRLFFLQDDKGNLVSENVNGRELGREAWYAGAEVVVYDYDLGLDEHIVLMSPLYAKHKT